MDSNFIYFIGFLIGLLFSSQTYSEVSSDYFINNFLLNTTKVKVYNNNITDIYLNNSTSTKFFLNLSKSDSIIKKIKKNNVIIEYSLDSRKVNNNIINHIFIIILLYLIMKRINKKNNRTSSIYSTKNSSIKLNDIAGLDYAKQEIFEFIDFLKNRDKYIKRGARMPRGALFYGPPGTGKTLLAKAISGESDVSFMSATGSDFVEVYVGVGASRIRDLFEEARKKAPCVLFIDEIDALGKKRSNCGTSSGNAERDTTLNKFLVELDGFEENDNIIVFGATNRLDVIDNALLRSGRFDRKIRFNLPEKSEREEIFIHYLKKLNLEDNIKEVAKNLSKLSFGFSGADISNICNEACILSVRNNKELITIKMLENAIDNVMLGPEKKTFSLSDKERKIIAYHEAGHTVMSYFLENTTKPVKVSIMPRGKSALGFSQREMSENKLKSKDELLDDMCVLLGGRISEEIFIKSITTGAYDDIQKLTELAYMFVTIYGMDDTISTFHYNLELKDRYSEDLKNKIDNSVKKIIDECYKKTKIMLDKKKTFVDKLALELLRKETLNQSDLELILNKKIYKKNLNYL